MSSRLRELAWCADMARTFGIMPIGYDNLSRADIGAAYAVRAERLENMTDAEYIREQQRIETAHDKRRDQDATPRYNRPVPLHATGWWGR